LSDEYFDNKSAKVKHHGGDVAFTGKYFLQKGEAVIPRALNKGGIVEGSPASSALQGVSVKIDTSDLLTKLEQLEISVDQTPLKVETTVLKVADTLLKVDAPTLKVADTVLKVDAPTLKVADTVLKVDSTPLKVADTILKVDAPLLQVADTVLKVDDTPLKVDATPLKVDVPILKVDAPILKVDSTPLKVDATPLKVDTAGISIPVDVSQVSVSVDIGDAASQLSTSIIEALNTKVNIVVPDNQQNSVGGEKIDKLAELISKVDDRLITGLTTVKDEFETKLNMIGTNNSNEEIKVLREDLYTEINELKGNNETSVIDRRIVELEKGLSNVLISNTDSHIKEMETKILVDSYINPIKQEVMEVRTDIGRLLSDQQQAKNIIEHRFNDVNYKLNMANNITGVGTVSI